MESDNQTKLLTLAEVAEILKVHTQTVRRYIHRTENPLPVLYISKQEMRIKEADLIEWTKGLPDTKAEAQGNV